MAPLCLPLLSQSLFVLECFSVSPPELDQTKQNWSGVCNLPPPPHRMFRLVQSPGFPWRLGIASFYPEESDVGTRKGVRHTVLLGLKLSARRRGPEVCHHSHSSLNRSCFFSLLFIFGGGCVLRTACCVVFLKKMLVQFSLKSLFYKIVSTLVPQICCVVKWGQCSEPLIKK